MAAGELSASVAPSGLPAAARPSAPTRGLVTGALLGYGLARLFDVVLAWVVGSRQGLGLREVLTSWDGYYYLRIAQSGYPDGLPVDGAGNAQASELAFFPAYPMLVRALATVTRLDVAWAAVLVSVVAGAAATALIVLVLHRWLSPATAVAGAVFWAFLPTATVCVMAYSDALFAAECALFFLLLARRRYLWIAVLLPVMGLTRGMLLPFVGVLATAAVVEARRATPEDRTGRALPLVGLVGVALASAALWPVTVALMTGRLDAYVATQSAWGGRGANSVPSVAPWVSPIQAVLTGVDDLGWTVGVIVVFVAVVALTVFSMRTPLSVELKSYAPSALLFLVLVVGPFTGVYRFLLPVFTLPATVAWAVRCPWGRLLVIALLVAGQAWWITEALGTQGDPLHPGWLVP